MCWCRETVWYLRMCRIFLLKCVPIFWFRISRMKQRLAPSRTQSMCLCAWITQRVVLRVLIRRLGEKESCVQLMCKDNEVLARQIWSSFSTTKYFFVCFLNVGSDRFYQINYPRKWHEKRISYKLTEKWKANLRLGFFFFKSIIHLNQHSLSLNFSIPLSIHD